MRVRYVVLSVRRRPWETAAAALSIAVLVAYIASLGSFVTQTGSGLTQRAAAAVPVDWQVQVTQGSDVSAVVRALRAVPGLQDSRRVSYARVRGLQSRSDSGVRTTGPAVVVALPPDYASFAPAELRALLGSASGVVLQQQTAANLAAAPGTVVTVLGSGRTVRIDGIVDLPSADSFFQVVGAPAGAGATAPPDNVLLVPPSTFSSLVSASTRVDQVHVQLSRGSLPSDPANAADEVTRRANHYAASVAGGALVGDNLSAALSAAREDALYARLLVLLLGVPGVLLAAVVTALVVSLRNDRQRRDLALLRLRGCTPRQAAGLLGGVAVIDGALGAALGTAGGAVASRLAVRGAGPSPAWIAAAATTGVLLPLVVELVPVAGLLRRDAAALSKGTAPPASGSPVVLRMGLDVGLLAASGLVFWLTSRNGYQVVVVPEGVAVASVDHAALLAPALAWPGLALLVWRVAALASGRRRRTPGVDPAGRLLDLRREVTRRRRRVIARGATGLAVAIGMTVAAAVFTRTYDEQARLDVSLTVGSDVAVTLPPDSPSTLDPALAQIGGVRGVAQVSHRLAYVGSDLQDLYGIDAATIGSVAPLQDAFTPGTAVSTALRRLARTPDGVLLSQETLHDYQLRPGDLVRLRLRTKDHGLTAISFHVVGVITEFATAPRDSFVLANRANLAAVTGLPQVQTLLVRTDHPAQVAAELRVPPGAEVNDRTSPRRAVGSASGLAAGSLAGLARLALGFGLLLAAASAALVLAVGAAQRRSALTALAILGATPRQRAGFLRTEARTVVGAGLIGGLVCGAVVAVELIKVLSGIFDPPPQYPTIPWSFVALLLGSVVASASVATLAAGRWASRLDTSHLRDG